VKDPPITIDLEEVVVGIRSPVPRARTQSIARALPGLNAHGCIMALTQDLLAHMYTCIMCSLLRFLFYISIMCVTISTKTSSLCQSKAQDFILLEFPLILS
jgi:hypothetical protein